MPPVFFDNFISEDLDTFLTGPERDKRRWRMRQDHL